MDKMEDWRTEVNKTATEMVSVKLPDQILKLTRIEMERLGNGEKPMFATATILSELSEVTEFIHALQLSLSLNLPAIEDTTDFETVLQDILNTSMATIASEVLLPLMVE
ncbi:hypothetical protein Pelo_9336 [Pelomyxa schiedti]|nr:hypothetical protein Pelo_9336 [Pelomyxa schiedti]